MQPPPFEHEQWVSYTGYEFEAMDGGQAESIPVILEVDAALHLAQWVNTRRRPTGVPRLPLVDPEEGDIESEKVKDRRREKAAGRHDGSNGHILFSMGQEALGCFSQRLSTCSNSCPRPWRPQSVERMRMARW